MHLYIPAYNSLEFLQSLEVEQGFDVTVFDNYSEDQSVAACKKKRWNVVESNKTTNRVENWERAIRHFSQSTGSPWCKWLFTGDELYQDAHSILKRAIQDNPEARLIIAEYDIQDHQGKKTQWQMFPSTRVIKPIESMLLAAKKGNWFGSPIGYCFHREAISSNITIGKWEWVADMQFCLNIAKKHPVLYLTKTVGAFHAAKRNTYSTQLHALHSRIEEYLLRKQAADTYFEMTQDKKAYNNLLNVIEENTELQIVQSSFARNKKAPHIIQSIPKRHAFKSLGNFLRSSLQPLTPFHEESNN